jgi:FAD:protein FMN transferase
MPYARTGFSRTERRGGEAGLARHDQAARTAPRGADHGHGYWPDVRDASVAPDALEQAFEYLRGVDARFSPYKPESEVSRLIRGEIVESDASRDLAEVLAMSEEIRRASEGYFDIRRHRPDGRPDPTGLVKGWSLEHAGRILEAAGARNHCINGGGDIVARGEAAPGRAWRIGIRHPLIADALATVLAIRDGAVATSGPTNAASTFATRSRVGPRSTCAASPSPGRA